MGIFHVCHWLLDVVNFDTILEDWGQSLFKHHGNFFQYRIVWNQVTRKLNFQDKLFTPMETFKDLQIRPNAVTHKLHMEGI